MPITSTIQWLALTDLSPACFNNFLMFPIIPKPNKCTKSFILGAKGSLDKNPVRDHGFHWCRKRTFHVFLFMPSLYVSQMWCMDGVYIIDKLILCVEYLNTSCIISLCRKSKRLCYSHVCVQIKCTSLVCFLHIYWQKYLKALCHSFASWKKPTLTETSTFAVFTIIYSAHESLESSIYFMYGWPLGILTVPEIVCYQ